MWTVDGVGNFTTCLLPMVKNDQLEAIKLHKHYEKGNLFKRGGISDQPAKYLKLMDIIENHIND